MRLTVLVRATLLTTCLFSFEIAAQSSTLEAWGNNRFTPVYASEGMVVAEERLASEVGAKVLADGGNAVDAAVATGFALVLTLPSGANIGGGGFMLVHHAETNSTVAIDYRETAPARATRDMFLDAEGNVDRGKARGSLLSSGIPGTVAGLLHAHGRFGTMPLKRLLAPAIKFAEDGFPLGNTTRKMLANFTRKGSSIDRNPAARGYFLKANGESYATGEIMKNHDLAWSLKQLSQHGADAFYKGAIADKIVTEMKRGGGLIDHQDLANYRFVEREPVWGSFHGYRIASMPPPSSGGVHIVQMLNVLEGYDLKSMGHNSAEYLHHLAESMRVAYADRSRYLGDPDFDDVPVGLLTGKDYAVRTRAAIKPNQITPSDELAPGAYLPEESPQTTHYSIADRFGNVVSNSYSLNSPFGSGIAVPGAGFLLNNHMNDFSAKPGTQNLFGLQADGTNAIEVGKRPLSSMAPTIVFKENKPYLVTGSPNGGRIITGILQVVLNALAFDMNIAAATSRARVHHQWRPDKLIYETGHSSDTLKLLESRGHNLQRNRFSIGMVQSIMLSDGLMAGAADPRRPSAYVASPETLRNVPR